MVPGRPAKLSGPQPERLYTLIVGTDPRQLPFGFALWTRDLVRLRSCRLAYGHSMSTAESWCRRLLCETYDDIWMRPARRWPSQPRAGTVMIAR